MAAVAGRSPGCDAVSKPATSGGIVIFLGPSLPLEEARQAVDADYRPPVRRGDVDRLLEAGRPDVLGIVDGLFFQSFAVSPKEILRALRAGVVVYGASSMGALRAVELERWGMRGVGRVFELYRSGSLEADDEVAMIYGEDGRRALSQPMVNIRHGLRLARRAGCISRREERWLCGLAKRTYFPQRSFEQVLADGAAGIPRRRLDALRAFLAQRRPDIKRDDALLLLRAVRDEAGRKGLSARPGAGTGNQVRDGVAG